VGIGIVLRADDQEVADVTLDDAGAGAVDELHVADVVGRDALHRAAAGVAILVAMANQAVGVGCRAGRDDRA